MEEFLESCRATSLLAELEDDEELPEADEEDEDENEEDCEDNYDEETSESSRSLLRYIFCSIYHGLISSMIAKKSSLTLIFTALAAVLWILDILVRIRIRLLSIDYIIISQKNLIFC
jgi:hypothetical protein